MFCCEILPEKQYDVNPNESGLSIFQVKQYPFRAL